MATQSTSAHPVRSHGQGVRSRQLTRRKWLRPLAVLARYEQKIVQTQLRRLLTHRPRRQPDHNDVGAQVGSQLLLDLIFIEGRRNREGKDIVRRFVDGKLLVGGA